MSGKLEAILEDKALRRDVFRKLGKSASSTSGRGGGFESTNEDVTPAALRAGGFEKVIELQAEGPMADMSRKALEQIPKP